MAIACACARTRRTALKLSPSSCHGEAGPVVSERQLVALVGNPNAGKTTLFNSLTGSHQKVGNYPGVTVEKVTGTLNLASGRVACIDVPGLYSLSPVSEDERVAAEVIEGVSEGVAIPDLLVCVVDATNLERNLYFYSQLVETGLPIVVALTMVDRLKGLGKEVDLAKLSQELGAEVVPLVGHRDQGIDLLRAAIERNLQSPHPASINLGLPAVLEAGVDRLREKLARAAVPLTKAEIRRSLLGGTEEGSHLFAAYPEVREEFVASRREVEEAGVQANVDVSVRYAWSAQVSRTTIRSVGEPAKAASRTDKIDAILTHRVFGFGIFVLLMYGVFQSIYTLAQPLMDVIQGLFDKFGDLVSPRLASIPWLQSLLVDGLIKGVGGVMVFLPQILILFFFIAILEGTGYLARAAFLMDRLLGWCGLNGRAFIPLLSSFACAIPGIMAARVMPDAKSRLATIMVAPLMSCSARLPVYLLLIGAFIQPRYGTFWAGFTLFAMHFLGLLVSIPVVWIFNRRVIKGKRLPFLLELPPYQWPKWRDVMLAMYFRARVFVQTAGTIIVAMSVIIWALSYFPRYGAQELQAKRVQYTASHAGATASEIDRQMDEQQLAHSYLGTFGKEIEPAFAPAGFDWRITTSILAAFPAREMVVPSLGIIFSVGKDVDEHDLTLKSAVQEARWPDGKPLFTPWTAIGMMVFFALCAQCLSTLATVRRETNSLKWPVVMFTYMTALAYVGAVVVHLIGNAFGA